LVNTTIYSGLRSAKRFSSVSVGVSVGDPVGVSQAFLRAKSFESQLKTPKETLEKRLAR
jgi:hypothetical protein